MPDKKIDILLKLQSDVSALRETQKKLDTFSKTVANGFQFSIVFKISSQLQQIPQKLLGAANAGILFNESLEQSEISFSTLLGSSVWSIRVSG